MSVAWSLAPNVRSTFSGDCYAGQAVCLLGTKKHTKTQLLFLCFIFTLFRLRKQEKMDNGHYVLASSLFGRQFQPASLLPSCVYSLATKRWTGAESRNLWHIYWCSQNTPGLYLLLVNDTFKSWSLQPRHGQLDQVHHFTASAVMEKLNSINSRPGSHLLMIDR